jgi:hypothetical protein
MIMFRTPVVMAKTLTIVAHARAKPGMEQKMIAAQIQLVEATRGTAGCLRYELHLTNHNPADVRAAGSAIGSFQLHEMQQIS